MHITSMMSSRVMVIWMLVLTLLSVVGLTCGYMPLKATSRFPLKTIKKKPGKSLAISNTKLSVGYGRTTPYGHWSPGSLIVARKRPDFMAALSYVGATATQFTLLLTFLHLFQIGILRNLCVPSFIARAFRHLHKVYTIASSTSVDHSLYNYALYERALPCVLSTG